METGPEPLLPSYGSPSSGPEAHSTEKTAPCHAMPSGQGASRRHGKQWVYVGLK